MEVREREKRSSDLALCDTSRQLESQRLQLIQANRWAGQAQRERISLHGIFDMRSRLFQIAKKLKNNEDSVAKKKKKPDNQELTICL